MNICLILAQRILDLFNEAGLTTEEREATVEVVKAMVRESVGFSDGPTVAGERPPQAGAPSS